MRALPTWCAPPPEPSVALGLAIVAVAPARAQSVRPWIPPGADSLVHWAAEAKVRFRENAGDTVGGTNYRAYELVGTMGRRLVRSLGKQGVLQAPAIEGARIVGLDTDARWRPCPN